MRFHDLRHSHATLLLGQGVHPKIVAERLGHSQIATTMELYTGVVDRVRVEAMDAIGALLWARRGWRYDGCIRADGSGAGWQERSLPVTVAS